MLRLDLAKHCSLSRADDVYHGLLAFAVGLDQALDHRGVRQSTYVS